MASKDYIDTCEWTGELIKCFAKYKTLYQTYDLISPQLFPTHPREPALDQNEEKKKQ